MKNKGAKPKPKRKGAAGAFGCDLTEHLESSGQDVPYVLRSCAKFIETHGIVDGIYRLSGVTSNIQKLRQEFGSDQCPDLTREVYLQDIHCVGSLCKLYFRELPNPLLTYELYKKFTEAISRCPEEEQLARIQNVIQELPPSHYRTLEYLIKHLTHLASFSNMTNMHTRNLALVWAPNLLRSKEIEAVGCNGDAAFLEVRVQQLVIEFILNHVDQIFSNNITTSSMEHDENMPIVKSLTLPSASLPMKLVSLEEAQARSLSASHPARKERRENSLPEIVPVTGSFFHTVVDLPDSKRKLSTKSKKWKSIFNLGRSGSDSKSKLSRNGSVFVRGQKLSEKATIRPAKSMDSLCSLPVEGEDEKGRFKRTVAAGGFFIPVIKTRTGGTSSSGDLSKESEWDREGSPAGAEGGSELSGDKAGPRAPQARPPPEQLKVFRAMEDTESEQTSPKTCRMFYTSETASKSGFPSSLFPLEASPRHQRKVLNISEPFAVSVPLRVSAVISTNSTPCRVPAKDKPGLSSLEESSALGPGSAAPTALEVGGQPRTEQATDREEKQPGAEAAPGSTTEELMAAKKPESSETSKPTTENQELLGSSSSTSGRQAPEQSPGLKQTPASEGPGGLHSAGEIEQGQLATQENPSERGSRQQETPRVKADEASFLRELAEDDAANALMEPLWPEIQQELKIIESEEELSFLPTDVPKTGPHQPASSASPQTDSFCSGSLLAVTLADQETPSGTPQATSQLSLFGASSKESSKEPGSRQGGKPEVVPQRDCSPNIPELDTVLSGTASPKNHLVLDNVSSDLPAPHQDQKLYDEKQLIEGPFKEDVSDTKGLCPDQTKEKGNPGLLHSEKDGIAVDQDGVLTQREKPDREAAGDGLISSKRASGAGAQKPKEGGMANRAQDSFDHEEEDAWTDNVQGFELVEPWEDHQWVTSPLHSPTLRNLQEKAMQDFQSESYGVERGFSARPRFSRSLSLDSKDMVLSVWAIQPPLTSAAEELPHGCTRSGTRDLLETLPTSPLRPNHFERAKTCLSPREDYLEPEGSSDALSSEAEPASGRLLARHEKLHPASLSEPGEKVVDGSKENPQDLTSELPFPHCNTQDGFLQAEKIDEDPSRPQDGAPTGAAVTKGLCSTSESQPSNNKGEDAPRKVRTRPSSLNLDSLLPAPNFFKFESLAVPTSPGNLLCAQKEGKSSDSVLSLPAACPARNKGDPWGSRFDLRELDLDYTAVAHAATGRRNSAPVSVSAVRTSFMIKLCQARAVPVIPPKIQYTQVPQPLQTQNADRDISALLGRKETEAHSASRQTPRAAWGQLEPPKSPRVEKKAKKEKENSDPTQMDSTSSRHGNLNPLPDLSLSSRNSTQEAPMLRRKRTSEGETTGDNPQSSKMERPSGFSKPSYRSRPGRPQSLILFSPPFPIMDHSSSSADSRVLLSPIRSPSQSNSPNPICSDLSGNLQTTPEGVTLRNKMTIPKNGQRLETSTSCFYQPQRRSVILDGRSGRQIE
ncbi:rho GTPase-activating protein 31 isoform X1 [Chelonoidis abingdonii]|uniref:rho GTPase-activating protein 31 isoform X1 n=1 Tax=Chelonoidis abingdonii TaxID=106734 RepID=UPI0013F23A91|nr:rho GTPase-activating protein 31 isoform X2 [Chelonoidis abingdonii]